MASPTEAEFEAVMASFDRETAAAVRAMREELTRKGITTEPLRTRMACEFAEVMLSSKGKKNGKSNG